ncbi:hypothetical protein PTTG_27285 [Puccinia triticina 1-1 BBBD Race 1]|uniref:Uncharacterized protein n=1 Tax=Puccinia triticina (isolate 1-1 / race 1 (BBBD)) TaxID=630390 RepID=A0A180GMD9_PUCT1|nr:hypothetical protein PTTG_27285 [Puccinia triticina 1-1 BBBD Race 1]
MEEDRSANSEIFKQSAEEFSHPGVVQSESTSSSSPSSFSLEFCFGGQAPNNQMDSLGGGLRSSIELESTQMSYFKPSMIVLSAKEEDHPANVGEIVPPDLSEPVGALHCPATLLDQLSDHPKLLNVTRGGNRILISLNLLSSYDFINAREGSVAHINTAKSFCFLITTGEADLSFAQRRTGVGPDRLLTSKGRLRNEGKLDSFQLACGQRNDGWSFSTFYAVDCHPIWSEFFVLAEFERVEIKLHNIITSIIKLWTISTCFKRATALFLVAGFAADQVKRFFSRGDLLDQNTGQSSSPGYEFYSQEPSPVLTQPNQNLTKGCISFPVHVEFILFVPITPNPPSHNTRKQRVSASTAPQSNKVLSKEEKIVIEWLTNNTDLIQFKNAVIQAIKTDKDEAIAIFRRLESAAIFEDFVHIAQITPDSGKIVCCLVQKNPKDSAQRETVYKHLKQTQASTCGTSLANTPLQSRGLLKSRNACLCQSRGSERVLPLDDALSNYMGESNSTKPKQSDALGLTKI